MGRRPYDNENARRDAVEKSMKYDQEILIKNLEQRLAIAEARIKELEPKPVVITRSFHILPEISLSGYYTWKVTEGAMSSGNLKLTFENNVLVKADVLINTNTYDK